MRAATLVLLAFTLAAPARAQRVPVPTPSPVVLDIRLRLAPIPGASPIAMEFREDTGCTINGVTRPVTGTTHYARMEACLEAGMERVRVPTAGPTGGRNPRPR